MNIRNARFIAIPRELNTLPRIFSSTSSCIRVFVDMPTGAIAIPRIIATADAPANDLVPFRTAVKAHIAMPHNMRHINIDFVFETVAYPAVDHRTDKKSRAEEHA